MPRGYVPYAPFACGHVLESVVKSPTALDAVESLCNRDRLAVCSAPGRDGASSVAVTDGCATLWVAGCPYSIRRLLRCAALKAVYDDTVECTNARDIGEWVRRPAEDMPVAARAAVRELLDEQGAEDGCPACRAALVYRVAALTQE